jgi:endonuclease YncB( thermonuclease family)
MTPAYIYRATVHRVIDGDTFETLVDLGFEVHRMVTVRVKDLRCPERFTTEGKAVTAAAFRLLGSAPQIVVKSYKDQQSFARWICDVWLADGRTYSEALAASVVWTDPGK